MAPDPHRPPGAPQEQQRCFFSASNLATVRRERRGYNLEKDLRVLRRTHKQDGGEREKRASVFWWRGAVSRGQEKMRRAKN